MKRRRSFLAIGPKPAYTGCSYSKQPRQLQCRQSGNANRKILGTGWTRGRWIGEEDPINFIPNLVQSAIATGRQSRNLS
ncbi:hypothetical protein [Oscillatoria sp. HE19RPO]|uniref:hypothetical protein n=1 Tax=Oscillatoria sp. HE19RPO TaxID=2954806 RepID=UPI0020C58F4C|nr:hypothetical protein [Oscillatoria sp. HE19RPO]